MVLWALFTFCLLHARLWLGTIQRSERLRNTNVHYGLQVYYPRLCFTCLSWSYSSNDNFGSYSTIINWANIKDSIWTIDLKIRITYCSTNCSIVINVLLKQIIYEDISTRWMFWTYYIRNHIHTISFKAFDLLINQNCVD